MRIVTLLAATAFGFAGIQAASAADMGLPLKAPPPPPPAWTWTGILSLAAMEELGSGKWTQATQLVWCGLCTDGACLAAASAASWAAVSSATIGRCLMRRSCWVSRATSTGPV